MLAAESRYVGGWLAIAAAILVPAAVALRIGHVAHFAAWEAVLLWFGLMCASLVGITMLWLRSERRNDHRFSAKTAPIVVSFVPLGFLVYWWMTWAEAFRATHQWSGGADLLFIQIVVTIFVLYTTLPDWYRRLMKVPLKTSAFTEKRRSEWQAAAALPTLAERRNASRPIRLRGYARLALIVAGIALMLALIPNVGLIAAYVTSFGTIAALFVILHKLYDL